jgi:predicted RecB family nuclease
VPGIGSTTAKKLTNAGIKDANTLAKANPQEIAEILGVSLQKAKTLIKNAKSVI